MSVYADERSFLSGAGVTSLDVARPRWRWVVCDWAGVPIGEPRAFDRTVSFGISRPASAAFRIRTDDRLWEQIAAGEAKLRIYHSGGGLCLYGPIVSDEEQAAGDGASVVLTAADLSWILGHRYVGRDPTGVGTTYTNQDSGAIAFDVLSTVNGANATGISTGTTEAFLARTVTYLWKNALTAISELGAIAGSYEWGLRYVDGSPPSVFLDLAAVMGTDRTSEIFLEYGTGKNNCSYYQRQRTIETLANRVVALGSGSTILAEVWDVASEATRGRHEDILSVGDITVPAVLDSLASAHVAVRKDPRKVVSLTPLPLLAPRYGVDYFLGDRVSARVVVKEAVRVQGAVRVWGVDIAIDESGTERPTLRLIPD